MPQKDVLYGFDVVDALPESETRPSVLEDAVAQIKANPELVGKAVIIARYKNRTAASAAANTLRKRHGQPDANGFKFECHRDKESDRSALYVVFNPEWATDEGKARHENELAADKEKKAQQARERRAAKQAEAAAPKAGDDKVKQAKAS